jgi:hypothetical protein
MATSRHPFFSASSASGPILVTLSPSKTLSSSSGLLIDSRVALGGRNPLQTRYRILVTFDAETQRLVIIEDIKSTAKAGNGIQGGIIIPFDELAEPAFEYSKSRGASITIALPLRQATDLRTNRFHYDIFGTWKDATKNMLQLRQVGDMTSKIRRIEIDISGLASAPSLARKQILNVLNQSNIHTPTAMPLPPSTTTATPDSDASTTRQAAATETPAETMGQMMPKEEKEGNRMNKQESEMKEVESQAQQDTRPTPEMGLEQAEQEESLQAEFARLKQQLSVATAPVQPCTKDSESVDLLDLEGDSTLATDTTQPSWLELELNMPGAYPLSDDSWGSSLIPACEDQPVTHATTHPAAPSCEPSAVTDNTIMKIEDAVEAMGKIQKEALRNGKAVTVEIKDPEEMAEWLKTRGAGVPSSAGSKRTLVMMWL